MFNERIDRAIEIDSNNDYLQRHHELEAPIKRLDDVAVIERGAWKMYVSLICRRSPEKSPDRAIFNRPIRHHIYRNQYIARDSETGRFGVDERLNKELNDWDRKYKNISVPVVLAVHIMPRHCPNPVHNWITNFFYGNQSPSSSDHMNDDLWIAGKHDGWFNQRQRHLDAVWVFTGLNPWRMSMTRHQIYFNHENENQRVIREILSPYISSSIMTDKPPNELSQSLGCDFTITH
ncbi:MAG: hypothetical protein OXE59_04485 [Bacteroidetes bacterium]|nr:hypothetical protein [Bacteroidota bacterium]